MLQPNLYQLDMVLRNCRLWWPLWMTWFPWTPLLRNTWLLNQSTSMFRVVTLWHSTRYVSSFPRPNVFCSMFLPALISHPIYLCLQNLMIRFEPMMFLESVPFCRIIMIFVISVLLSIKDMFFHSWLMIWWSEQFCLHVKFVIRCSFLNLLY